MLNFIFMKRKIQRLENGYQKSAQKYLSVNKLSFNKLSFNKLITK